MVGAIKHVAPKEVSILAKVAGLLQCLRISLKNRELTCMPSSPMVVLHVGDPDSGLSRDLGGPDSLR